MITKVRIIKEEGVYRIQEYNNAMSNSWAYAHQSFGFWGILSILDLNTQKEAEDYVEKNYVVRLIKEYDVSGLKKEKE